MLNRRNGSSNSSIRTIYDFYKLYRNSIFNITLTLVSILNMVRLTESSVAWTPDIIPKLNIRTDYEQFPMFFGNRSDHFKLLLHDADSILIGARNALYNISLHGLLEQQQQRIEWMSSDADRELCALKGKQEEDCQNYVRVYARINENQTLICGTNSYKPRCRTYGTISGGSSNGRQNWNVIKEYEAQGRCPYSPSHHSTFIYTNDQLYSATVADFSGADPLIYREPQRTEQYDLKQLNQPAFVKALERNGYVFFFFREIAAEYMNCGKSIYSRIGRVCKNDKGGPYGSSERWTTFLKTRLNCSMPGEYPFYFDEIQATSEIIDALQQQQQQNNLHQRQNSDTTAAQPAVVYAVFTTSNNAIPGSAVCAFTLDAILDAFESRFKAQKDSQSNWLPVPNEWIPQPRPGKCVDDSRTLSSNSMSFVKTHTLMEEAVHSQYGIPLITRVNLRYKLTAIAVDPHIEDVNGHKHDILFAGTDDGKIIKFYSVNWLDPDDGVRRFRTIVVSELQSLPLGDRVRELLVSTRTDALIVIGDDRIASIPLNQCRQLITCYECLYAEDPYCAWDANNHECVSRSSVKGFTQSAEDFSAKKQFLQSINSDGGKIERICRNVDKSRSSGTGTAGGSIGIVGGGGQYQQKTRPIVIQATRGTVSSIGRMLPTTNVMIGGGEITLNLEPKDGIAPLSSAAIDLENSVNEQRSGFDFDGSSMIDDDNVLQASIGGATANRNNFYWSFAGLLLILIFGIGILVGIFASRRLCKNSPLLLSAEHRNQLTPSRLVGGGGGSHRNLHHHHNSSRNCSKDINLLMKTVTTTATPPTPASVTIGHLHHTQQINNKIDNLEHEFAVVDDKDRRHECKNSTENLEKDLECMKSTGTLTKVKRTYI